MEKEEAAVRGREAVNAEAAPQDVMLGFWKGCQDVSILSVRS